ncbi:TetR/AcrR family transcriptional regulator [Kribbella sp. NBC_01245]|uniref:TetR/AcrR family transcriptional regulator n=1 Tax=Kribbella sp. NBC_01245 TaxID=2903578 RepID=UPI002E2DC0DD|nr:TetR/AcrR family transcriptional regulator [Kribbella sp. NBC_01245]
MTTEYSGSGDPVRTLELLWGLQAVPTRGPKPAHTVADVVRAAIEVADAEGLTAMSIRRVADHLGVGAMTLYRYVPGKAELLDLMVDTVLGELTQAAPTKNWRADLEAMARDTRALYLRHRWLIQVATSRPPMGPNVMAKYERELSIVEGIGLSDIDMDAAIALMNEYVHGAVRGAIESDQIQKESGLTHEEWWVKLAPVLARVPQLVDYPLANRVGTAVGVEFNAPYDPDYSFEFGLGRVLDGIESLLKA